MPAWWQLPIAAFLVGVVGTWLARRYALRRGLLDHPGERRSHALPTPRGGGISIVIAMLVVLAWLGWREPGQGAVLAAIAARTAPCPGSRQPSQARTTSIAITIEMPPPRGVGNAWLRRSPG